MAGSGISGIGVIALIYNFFNMYTLAGKCPEDIDIQPCQAYDNWAMLNKIGLAILAVGIVVLIIGFLKRYRNKV